MFSRPIQIWLILAFLAYSAFGTISAIARGFGSGAISYNPFILALSAFSTLLSIWLIVEIWIEGRRQVLLAWILFGVLASIQLFAVTLFRPNLLDGLSDRQEYTAVTIFSLVLVVLYALIPIYLTRVARKDANKEKSRVQQ